MNFFKTFNIFVKFNILSIFFSKVRLSSNFRSNFDLSRILLQNFDLFKMVDNLFGSKLFDSQFTLQLQNCNVFFRSKLLNETRAVSIDFNVFLLDFFFHLELRNFRFSLNSLDFVALQLSSRRLPFYKLSLNATKSGNFSSVTCKSDPRVWKAFLLLFMNNCFLSNDSQHGNFTMREVFFFPSQTNTQKKQSPEYYALP